LLAVVRAGLETIFRKRMGELLEQMALLLGELLWYLHLHGREEIAAAVAVDIRQSLAAESKRGAGLRAFRHFHPLVPVEGRNGNVASEGKRGEIHRNLAEQVDAVAPEELVLADVNHHI